MPDKKKKAMVSARIDIRVKKALDQFCKDTRISKEAAVEKPLSEAYLGKKYQLTTNS